MSSGVDIVYEIWSAVEDEASGQPRPVHTEIIVEALELWRTPTGLA